MIPITIDGKSIEVEAGTTLLAAAKSLGITIPTLCDHKALEPAGSCRVCVTEIEEGGRRKVVTACNYPVRRSLAAFTDSEETRAQRGGVLRMMLARWPNVPILQNMARYYKVEPPTWTHPLRTEDEDACILCGQCVRACSEMVWEDIIAFAGRGPSRHVTMPFGEQYERCTGCATCAWICPTGAVKVTDELNKPVDAELIRKYGFKLTQEMATLDDQQCRMRRVGTTYLVEIMDAYDLLPTFNFQYGTHPEVPKISAGTWINYFRQNVPDGCWVGCQMACAKGIEGFTLRTGPYAGDKVLIDGPEYETVAGCGSNLGVFDPDIIAEINFYCDTYGLDTISFGTGLAFTMECFEAGILNEEITGGLNLRFGSGEAALEILHQMGRGDGFGVIVGQGVRKMKEHFAREYGGDPQFLQDIGMEVKGLEYSEYVSKESLAQQGGFAMAQKGPQHDEAWLIFMDMVNNQLPTFEDKAEALYYFPMFRTWFGLVGLCKLPWNDVTPEDNAETDEPHKIPSHVEGYLNFFEGMTGRKITENDLLRQSERVYNLQRVFGLRMGKGTREHDRGPYRAMGPVTAAEYESRADRYDKQLKEKIGIDPEGMSTDEKRAALRKHREGEYEKLLDAVYKRRGWSRNGIPTVEHLKEIGIGFPWVLEVVKPHLEKESV